MLGKYIRDFTNLRVDLAHPPERVHKPCMLLVVIELAESGALTENRVRYEDTWEGFKAYASIVRPDQDMKPHLPFYHLKTADFWSLVKREGGPELKPKHRPLLGASARLERDLHRLLCDSPEARAELRYVLIERWFPEKRAAVLRLVKQTRSSSRHGSGGQ